MSSKCSILVIGDLIIDETWYVHVSRKNPEAPAITADFLSKEPSSISLGGAGFAAQLAAKQGHDVTLFSFLSPIAKKILNDSRLNISNTLWFSKEIDLNITKTRFIDNQQGYHVFRTDNDNLVSPPWPQSSFPVDYVIAKIDNAIRKGISFDLCLLSDYVKGFFSGNGWRTLLKFLSDKRILSVLDSKSLGLFPWQQPQVDHDVWIKLNDNEFDHFKKTFGIRKKEPSPKEIFETTNITNKFVITHGKNGASIYKKDDTGYFLNTALPEIKSNRIVDPTGCGDIFDIKFLLENYQNVKEEEALRRAVNYASHFAQIPMESKFL